MTAKDLIGVVESVCLALRADSDRMQVISRGRLVTLNDAPAGAVWAFIKGRVDDEIKRSRGGN